MCSIPSGQATASGSPGPGGNLVVRTLVGRIKGRPDPGNPQTAGAQAGRAAQGRNTLMGRAAASLGGVPTILTSGSGVAGMAPTSNKTLLGQ